MSDDEAPVGQSAEPPASSSGDAGSNPAGGTPLPLMSDEDIVKHARDIITNVSLLADANDRDWAHSLMLLIGGLNPIPSNASSLFIVPMGPHMGGRWLNGRVPGVTLSATIVPMENVEPLIAKCDEFYRFLHPEEGNG